jgi:type IV secretory pathway VirB10-like protein
VPPRRATDPDIIAATIERPGIVLKRPVGSEGPFGEHSELPKSFGGDEPRRPPSRKVREAKKPSAKLDKAAERKTAQAYERERQRRDREEAKEEAARQKERERRERAVEKAQAALNEAEREHAKRATALRSELGVIEDRIRSEDDDWGEEEKRLKGALKRARDGRT